ncbi:hypothetical protein [Leifsonia poae]|uniref:Uncharacterized protein n=1 Tax=Leifsonia poae TaxID=110933 RepID=A0A9W6H6U4_9MICO|nr:hypothetical protein [Leifsonia poae]GLJ74725.1 hypothetical protein GCM10017584_02980 [Leifsonia poae]
MSCGTPSPTPTPTPTPTHSGLPLPIAPVPTIPLPGGGSSTGTPTPGATTAPTAPPVAPKPDAGSPTFTLPAAQLTGSSISFAGIPTVSVVKVPLANGMTTPVLKLTADDIVITDFHLNVRKATGPQLLTDAGRMELRGHVQVYVDSVTAVLGDGTPLTLGADTPPPDGKVPAALLRVHLGLVGVTADQITLIPSNQVLTE